MPPKTPCKVYFLRENGPSKELTARNPDELEALLRIGWQLEDKKAE